MRGGREVPAIEAAREAGKDWSKAAIDGAPDGATEGESAPCAPERY